MSILGKRAQPEDTAATSRMEATAHQRKCLRNTNPNSSVPAVTTRDKRAIEQRAIMDIAKEMRPRLMSWNEIVIAALVGSEPM
jgi:hypothetical protein